MSKWEALRMPLRVLLLPFGSLCFQAEGTEREGVKGSLTFVPDSCQEETPPGGMKPPFPFPASPPGQGSWGMDVTTREDASIPPISFPRLPTMVSPRDAWHYFYVSPKSDVMPLCWWWLFTLFSPLLADSGGGLQGLPTGGLAIMGDLPTVHHEQQHSWLDIKIYSIRRSRIINASQLLAREKTRGETLSALKAFDWIDTDYPHTQQGSSLSVLQINKFSAHSIRFET